MQELSTKMWVFLELEPKNQVFPKTYQTADGQNMDRRTTGMIEKLAAKKARFLIRFNPSVIQSSNKYLLFTKGINFSEKHGRKIIFYSSMVGCLFLLLWIFLLVYSLVGLVSILRCYKKRGKSNNFCNSIFTFSLLSLCVCVFARVF